MYVCVCVCVSVYVYVYVCFCVCLGACPSAVCVYMCVCVCVRICSALLYLPSSFPDEKFRDEWNTHIHVCLPMVSTASTDLC